MFHFSKVCLSHSTEIALHKLGTPVMLDSGGRILLDGVSGKTRPSDPPKKGPKLTRHLNQVHRHKEHSQPVSQADCTPAKRQRVTQRTGARSRLAPSGGVEASPLTTTVVQGCRQHHDNKPFGPHPRTEASLSPLVGGRADKVGHCGKTNEFCMKNGNNTKEHAQAKHQATVPMSMKKEDPLDTIRVHDFSCSHALFRKSKSRGLLGRATCVPIQLHVSDHLIGEVQRSRTRIGSGSRFLANGHCENVSPQSLCGVTRAHPTSRAAACAEFEHMFLEEFARRHLLLSNRTHRTERKKQPNT